MSRKLPDVLPGHRAGSVVLVTIGLVLSILALIADDGQLGPFSHQFFTPMLTIAYGVVGALVASRHPRNPIGWIFCATGFLSALNMLSAGYALYDQLAVTTGSLPGAAFARWLSIWIWIPNVLLPITFVLLLFPDGRLLSTRWRPIAWAAGLGIAAFTLRHGFSPRTAGRDGHSRVKSIWNFGRRRGHERTDDSRCPAAPGGHTRLNRVGGRSVSERHRDRTRAVKVAGIRGSDRDCGQSSWAVVPWLIWGDNPITQELTIVITDLTIVNIVIATGIAILRYRLWDIDILINRTLVYGSLTALIVGIYVVIVGSLGTLLQTGSSLPVSLFATGIVAMSVSTAAGAPATRREPADVRRTRRPLCRARPPGAAARGRRRLAGGPPDDRGDGCRGPQTTLCSHRAEGGRRASRRLRNTHAPLDLSTSLIPSMEILPLVYQLETMGQLILAPRAPGEHFSQTDRRLLETIARQAGIAAYNVRLTQDLQRSRERLVTTREEERRRLRRDLHDGLGPALASMSFKLDAIHNLADRDPLAVKTTATDLKSQVQNALADIRRIAYDLRPPALDELGLVGALKEHIAACNQAQGLQITLEAPENLPPLAAAVEVAVYRIALEAMTNVSRHAEARHCYVRLSLTDDLLPGNHRRWTGLPRRRSRGCGTDLDA